MADPKIIRLVHTVWKARFESSTGHKGEVAEWSIAAVLKTALPQGNGGSNPSLSAQILCHGQEKAVKTVGSKIHELKRQGK